MKNKTKNIIISLIIIIIFLMGAYADTKFYQITGYFP